MREFTIPSFTLYEFIDDAAEKSRLRTDDLPKSDHVALVEYGYRRAIDDLLSFTKQLEAESIDDN